MPRRRPFASVTVVLANLASAQPVFPVTPFLSQLTDCLLPIPLHHTLSATFSLTTPTPPPAPPSLTLSTTTLLPLLDRGTLGINALCQLHPRSFQPSYGLTRPSILPLAQIVSLPIPPTSPFPLNSYSATTQSPTSCRNRSSNA